MKTEAERHADSLLAGNDPDDRGLFLALLRLQEQVHKAGFREVILYVLGDGRVSVEVPYHPGYTAPTSLRSLRLDLTQPGTFKGAIEASCQAVTPTAE